MWCNCNTANRTCSLAILKKSMLELKSIHVSKRCPRSGMKTTHAPHSCGISGIITWSCVFWHDFFHGCGLNQATYAQCQVISCVTKHSSCHHTLHTNRRHCLWKIPPIIAVKSNVITFIQVLRFIINMFYCGRFAVIIFKNTDIKGARQRLTSTVSLDDGYCEATIPVVKGYMT